MQMKTKILDESLKDITANILKNLNESTQHSLNQMSTSVTNVNTASSQQPNVAGESSDPKLNQLVLMINTTLVEKNDFFSRLRLKQLHFLNEYIEKGSRP